MTVTAQKLLNRINQNGLRYYASDNISEVFEDGDKEALIGELAEQFDGVLRTMLIDVDNDPNSQDTGRRLAKMYVNELFEGRYSPAPKVAAFPNVGANKYKGMLVARAELRSLCSHHHQPVKGVCYIGLLPTDKVIGLSKYTRLAQWAARRGTLQEELTQDIMQLIQKDTDCKDVGVIIRATHGCMTNRGVCLHNGETSTSALSGQFYNPSVKQEFLDLVKMQELAPKL